LLRLLAVDSLQGGTVRLDHRVEEILQGRPLEGALHNRRRFSVLGQRLEEMRIPQPRDRLDRAELSALRAARAPEIPAELREALRRQRLQRRQLPRDDADEGVDPLDGADCSERVPAFHCTDQRIELVEDDLEPQLARLMHDDEQQLIGMGRLRSWALKGEELVEREVGSVVEARVGIPIGGAHRVDTASATTSATSIVSVV
jgi:hypothetical protein